MYISIEKTGRLDLYTQIYIEPRHVTSLFQWKVKKNFWIKNLIDFYENSPLYYDVTHPEKLSFFKQYQERRSTTQSRWDARKLKRNIQKELDNNNIHATLTETRRKL